MGAGQYDHRVEIQSRTRASDQYGSSSSTWQTVATRWARIIDKSAREAFQEEQVRGILDCEVELRERYESLTTQHRFKVLTQNDRILHIVGAITDNYRSSRRGQRCTCKEEP